MFALYAGDIINARFSLESTFSIAPRNSLRNLECLTRSKFGALKLAKPSLTEDFDVSFSYFPYKVTRSVSSASTKVSTWEGQRRGGG